MGIANNRLPVPCPVCSAGAYVLCSTDAAGTPHEERVERAQGVARDADRLTMELRFGCLDRAIAIFASGGKPYTLTPSEVVDEKLTVLEVAAAFERYVTQGGEK